MTERYKIDAPKGAEFFDKPNPYDLVALSAVYDHRKIVPPPKNYIPATDPENQLKDVVFNLQQAFGKQLMFIGLTGSSVDHPDKNNRDLDILAVVDDDATAHDLMFNGDLKIVSYSGLKDYIEYGHQLIATQFSKAQPLFQLEESRLRLNESRSWMVIPEKAIPYLIAKSKFNEQTSDICRLMSNKYQAIFLHLHGMDAEAFARLDGEEQDDLFSSLQTEAFDDDPRIVNAQVARFYLNNGLNRMFQSISALLQALHIKETGEIPDVEPLVRWADLKFQGSISEFFRYVYEKRNACYKDGELLTDSSYETVRDGIRRLNPVLERMVLDGLHKS
jgi:hypothetical protein